MNQQKQKTIARVNNTDIVIIQNGEQRVPVKPICDALGIDFSTQVRKLKSDEILSTTVVIMPTVGGDEKQREMITIPYKYVFGWLFRIHPNKVSPEARESVLKYQMECYDVLYRHFTDAQEFLAEKQQAIEAEQAKYEEIQTNFKETKNKLADAKARLKKVFATTIEEWRFNNRQLSLFPEEEKEVSHG